VLRVPAALAGGATILDAVTQAVGCVEHDAAIVYGNVSASRPRDIDIWFEGDIVGLHLALEAVYFERVDRAAIDLSGPWSAPDDPEWIAIARWNATATGLLISGCRPKVVDTYSETDCIRVYQRRAQSAAQDLAARAVDTLDTDPLRASQMLAESMRHWLRANAKREQEWRAANRLGHASLLAQAADALSPSGCEHGIFGPDGLLGVPTCRRVAALRRWASGGD
jgi:hypothetical protein